MILIGIVVTRIAVDGVDGVNGTSFNSETRGNGDYILQPMAARPMAGPGDRPRPHGHKRRFEWVEAACVRGVSVDRSPRPRGAIGSERSFD